ncbi:MAG: hypothetical protein FJZ96_13930 [Chloroflexi bacterium]|nr:hypothetical protein [Chloroflexota bacterium]
MKDQDPTTHFQLRAAQYHLVDGTYEVFFGGICILWALFFYLQAKLSPIFSVGLLPTLVWTGGFIAVSFAGSFLLDRLTKAIRERLTYPRTGYIDHRRPRGGRLAVRILLLGMVVAILSALFTAFFASHPAFVNWMPLAGGALFALTMAIVAWRTQIGRYYLLAMISVIAGLGVSMFGLDELTGIAVFYGSLGFMLLVMGGVVLGLYLRRNPMPGESLHEQ